VLKAGVSTELHQYPGTFHGNALLVQTAAARRMIADKLDACGGASRRSRNRPGCSPAEGQ
jgi:acetyl esterase